MYTTHAYTHCNINTHTHRHAHSLWATGEIKAWFKEGLEPSMTKNETRLQVCMCGYEWCIPGLSWQIYLFIRDEKNMWVRDTEEEMERCNNHSGPVERLQCGSLALNSLTNTHICACYSLILFPVSLRASWTFRVCLRAFCARGVLSCTHEHTCVKSSIHSRCHYV